MRLVTGRVMGWYVRFIQVLVLPFRRIAATTAVAAALEALETLATARQSTATASDYTPCHRDEYQAADNNNPYDGPSRRRLSATDRARAA
jgi:uncharacterized protein YecT (DUF1311 family)